MLRLNKQTGLLFGLPSIKLFMNSRRLIRSQRLHQRPPPRRIRSSARLLSPPLTGLQYAASHHFLEPAQLSSFPAYLL